MMHLNPKPREHIQKSTARTTAYHHALSLSLCLPFSRSDFAYSIPFDLTWALLFHCFVSFVFNNFQSTSATVEMKFLRNGFFLVFFSVMLLLLAGYWLLYAVYLRCKCVCVCLCESIYLCKADSCTFHCSAVAQANQNSIGINAVRAPSLPNKFRLLLFHPYHHHSSKHSLYFARSSNMPHVIRYSYQMPL